MKKIEKFFNKQIKLLIKNRKILLGVLLVALLIMFNPMLEGLESDSFWCKYFSWFPGVSCDEPADTPTDTPSDTPAATPKNGSSNSTSASTPEEEEEEEEEPELSDCSCNANCQLKNNSEDRVLNEECKVPEGIEDVSNVSEYCDKCYDIVDLDCRLHTSPLTALNDPVVKADRWCELSRGGKITGASVLERCTEKDGNNIVPGGAWKGMTYADAYPKVLVNYMVDSDKFSGEGGKCENNMNPKLKWTEYAHPN